MPFGSGCADARLAPLVNESPARATMAKLILAFLACRIPTYASFLFEDVNNAIMIYLNDNLLFAEGGRRFCFVHPEDPSKCIKTLSPNGDPRKRKKEAVWYKKLRPLSMFDDNLRELKSFRDLERHGEAVWDHFPRCYGIQQTDRGPGIVTDLIRDAEGQISRTVRQYVKAEGKTPELLEALSEFLEFLKEHRVVTRDILDHNLVVAQRSDKLTIYLIDGFGSSDFLPLPKKLSKKIERKSKRFAKRYGFPDIG